MSRNFYFFWRPKVLGHAVTLCCGIAMIGDGGIQTLGRQKNIKISGDLT
jgi:hypothetical protein